MALSKKHLAPSERLPLGCRPTPPRSPLRFAQGARSGLQHLRERRTSLAPHRVGRVACLQAKPSAPLTDECHRLSAGFFMRDARVATGPVKTVVCVTGTAGQRRPVSLSMLPRYHSRRGCLLLRCVEPPYFVPPE